MKTIGLARLGKDAEVRYAPSGDAVANLSLAVNYGKPDSDGNRPTQWINASLWGKRAESLAQYLTKGSLHCFTLSDIHIEAYEGQNGTFHNLVARVDDVQLGPRGQGGNQGGGERTERPAANGGGQQRPARGDGRAAGQGGDMDDDIPF
jgi:single-strand DNA-binding protein